MPYLCCNSCEYFEYLPTNKYKAIGLGISAFGVFGWFNYLFAGSGHAFLISCAIVATGLVIYFFKAEKMAINSIKYKRCPKCDKVDWDEIPYENSFKAKK